jgi:hypothetical protein
MSQETNQNEQAPESPVLNPPHPFSEGEEVVTPEGTVGKIVSIDETDPAAVRFGVVIPSRAFFTADQLSKA